VSRAPKAQCDGLRARHDTPNARSFKRNHGEQEVPSEKDPVKPGMSTTAPFGMFGPAVEYIVDAAQRSVLFFDVMRQRGDQYREHLAEAVPHVLEYKVELVVDAAMTRLTSARSQLRSVSPRSTCLFTAQLHSLS